METEATETETTETEATETGPSSVTPTASPDITPDITLEPDSIAADSSDMLTGPGQVLPITAQATMGDEIFELEVAQTARQQQLGLMHRKALPDNRGMLFPFSPARPVSFWMKNVPVGLDMVFVYQGQVQGIAEAPPCEADPCPTYGPGRLLVDHVIELRIGRAAELGLGAGDRVEIRYLEE